jgi:hypothetical protein
MKIALCCATVLCVALSACQSAPVAESRWQYDVDQMARVESAARASGAKVYWVNPPLLKTAENAVK